MGYKFALAVVWAFVFGVCAVGSVQTSALAQLPPSEEVSNEHKVRQFRAWVEKTNADDFQERSRWRRIFTRSARSSLPGLGRKLLVRGGLIGAAAGVWVHNGVVLYNVGQCGETYCPEALVLDVEFRKAQDAASALDLQSVFYNEYELVNGDERLVGSFVLNSFDVRRRLGSDSYDVTITGTRKGKARFSNGFSVYFLKPDDSYVGGTHASTNWTTASPDVQDYEWTGVFTQPPNVANHASKVGVYRNIPPDGYISQLQPLEDYVSWENPVFDWGASTVASPEYAPAEGDYVATQQDSDALYNAIKSDPEYEPAKDDIPADSEDQQTQHERRVGELVPQHGPVIDTTTNPDGSVTTRFQDGTTLTTWPNGDETVRTPDGKESTRYKDGTREEWDPATRRLTTIYPDGTTRVRQYPEDGTNQRPSPSTQPQTDQWTDPSGRNISRPDTNTYPETAPRPAPSPPAGGGGGGGTPSTDLSCPAPLTAKPVLPDVGWEEKFPFSLIITAKETLGQLVGTPNAPTFNLPMIGQQDLSRFDGVMSVMRVVWLVLIGGILMPLMFYRLIKGGGE